MTRSITGSPPWFEDFNVGDEYSDVPAVTIHEGYIAMYQSIVADRSRLYLDLPLCRSVTGQDRLLVNPSLIGNIAIGQSTVPSQRVLGNLFYRGLRYHRPVFVGDTLTTDTRVVALRQNAPKPGRAASGMVALKIKVTNQDGATVMLFWRCPMIPCREPDADTGHQNDFTLMPEHIEDEAVAESIPDWNLEPLVAQVGQRTYEPGQTIEVEARDTVTSAPELVRLTLNMAMTHTDAARSVHGERLVYGGHTIALAAAQLSRVMPDLACILAWYKCDHLAPVFEEDMLAGRVTIHHIEAVARGRLARIQIEVFSERGAVRPPENGQDRTPGDSVKVLDWHLAALLG